MSTPRFHAGQLVEVVRADPLIADRFLGRRFVLEGAPVFCQASRELAWPTPADWSEEISAVMRSPIELVAEESSLKPIYDGDQLASWDDCAWRPALVKVPR